MTINNLKVMIEKLSVTGTLKKMNREDRRLFVEFFNISKDYSMPLNANLVTLFNAIN